MHVKTISAEKAHTLLRTDPGAVLVCAYEQEEEFRQNDLQGAISLSEFRRRIDSFSKHGDVIFYCACPHDDAATRQAERYKKRDFVNAQVLKGGVNAWMSRGYALVGTHLNPEDEQDDGEVG